MSPSMAAAAAVTGCLTDVRELATSDNLEAVTGQKSRDAREFLSGGAEQAPIPAARGADGAGAKGLAVAGGAAEIPKFTVLQGIACPLDMENVDTDKVVTVPIILTNLGSL